MLSTILVSKPAFVHVAVRTMHKRVLESSIQKVVVNRGILANRVTQKRPQLECRNGKTKLPRMVCYRSNDKDWNFDYSKSYGVDAKDIKITFEGWDYPGDKYVRLGSEVIVYTDNNIYLSSYAKEALAIIIVSSTLLVVGLVFSFGLVGVNCDPKPTKRDESTTPKHVGREHDWVMEWLKVKGEKK